MDNDISTIYLNGENIKVNDLDLESLASKLISSNETKTVDEVSQGDQGDQGNVVKKNNEIIKERISKQRVRKLRSSKPHLSNSNPNLNQNLNTLRKKIQLNEEKNEYEIEIKSMEYNERKIIESEIEQGSSCSLM